MRLRWPALVAPVALLATSAALAAPALPPLPRLLTERGVLARPAAAPTATISYGESPAQRIELFLPARRADDARLPVVALLGGNCWADTANLALLRPLAAALVDRGFAVWAIGYRGLGDEGGGYPGTFADVATAIDRIADEADAHALDRNRVLLFGHGAGATLALWAAGRRKIPQSSPLSAPEALRPRAVLAADGYGSLQQSQGLIDAVCGAGTIARLTAAADADANPHPDADDFADTSPDRLLPTHVPAVLLYGIYDNVAPPAVGYAFATDARRAGDATELQVAPVAGRYEVLSPGTAASAQALAAIARLLR